MTRGRAWYWYVILYAEPKETLWRPLHCSANSISPRVSCLPIVFLHVSACSTPTHDPCWACLLNAHRRSTPILGLFSGPFPASSVPVRCFGLLSLLLLNRYAFFLHDRVPPMPQRSCALIISHASFSRFLRLHRRLQAPPFSFLGKSLFLVSSKICRPFSSRAPCFVSLFPSRICAVHGYLFLFPSRFGSWPPAPSVRRLRGGLP